MRRTVLTGLAVAMPFLFGLSAEAAPMSIYDFSVKRIDGTAVPLDAYKGRVLLVVNVASKCGLTPQYEGLEALHDRFAQRGLSVLGFPANDFLWQEPGTNAEIATFCRSTYGVKFDMFEKIAVKGKAQDPLYAWLTKQDAPPKGGPGAISWNFEKFVVDREGHVVARFDPKTAPTDPKVVSAIEAALAVPAAEAGR